MSDTAPALKTMFRQIKKCFLQEIIAVDGSPLDLDWNLSGDDFYDALYGALSSLHKNRPQKFSAICTVLFDINAVCQDQRKGRYIIDQIKAAGRLAEAHNEISEIKPKIVWYVSWVLLRMPELWEKLRRSAYVKQIIGLGGQKKFIKRPQSDEPSLLQLRTFEAEFLKYMSEQVTLINFINIIREDLGSYVRYVLHVNPFPKDVEQFGEDGAFKLALDQNAEGFTIIHHKGDDNESYLRIKCAFNTSQRNHILELFAKFVLATEICDKPPEEYPIKGFNPTYNPKFTLTISNHLIADARVSAADLEIINPADGFIDEIYHKCKQGNLFERLSFSCSKFPVEWRYPVAWEFDIKLLVDSSQIVQQRFFDVDEKIKEPKYKNYHVRVTENTLTLNCQNEDHKQIIMDFLADNGIKNVFKKEFLSREYRK